MESPLSLLAPILPASLLGLLTIQLNSTNFPVNVASTLLLFIRFMLNVTIYLFIVFYGKEDGVGILYILILRCNGIVNYMSYHSWCWDLISGTD